MASPLFVSYPGRTKGGTSIHEGHTVSEPGIFLSESELQALQTFHVVMTGLPKAYIFT